MSSRAVRAPGQPRSGRAKNRQTDGCANPGSMTLPGSTNLNWVIESPLSTEVRLLEHTGSSSQDFQATESSRKVIVTSSKPGEGTRPPSQQAWLLASSHLPNPHSLQASRSAEVMREALHILVCNVDCMERTQRDGYRPPSLVPPLPPCLLPDSSLPPTPLQVLPCPPKTVGPEQCLTGVSGWYPRD